MARTLSKEERAFRDIPFRKDFEDVLDQLTISETQKQIAILYYIERIPCSKIAWRGEPFPPDERAISRLLRDVATKVAAYYRAHSGFNY